MVDGAAGEDFGGFAAAALAAGGEAQGAAAAVDPAGGFFVGDAGGGARFSEAVSAAKVAGGSSRVNSMDSAAERIFMVFSIRWG
jgi:hypothetical protein